MAQNNVLMPRALCMALEELGVCDGAGRSAVTWQLKFSASKIQVAIDYPRPPPFPPTTSSVTCQTSLGKDKPTPAGPPEAKPEHSGHRKSPSDKRRNKKRLVAHRAKKRKERRANREAELTDSVPVKDGSISVYSSPGVLDITASDRNHNSTGTDGQIPSEHLPGLVEAVHANSRGLSNVENDKTVFQVVHWDPDLSMQYTDYCDICDDQFTCLKHRDTSVSDPAKHVPIPLPFPLYIESIYDSHDDSDSDISDDSYGDYWVAQMVERHEQQQTLQQQPPQPEPGGWPPGIGPSPR